MNSPFDTLRLALVTGASRGIGVAIVQALLSNGWRVDVMVRDATAMRTAYGTDLNGGKVRVLVADVTDAETLQRLVSQNYGEEGAPDLLFNNAGRFVSFAPIWESEFETWWEDVRVNILGTFLVTRIIIPRMIARDSGIVINMGGGRPAAGSGYAVSKAGVAEFTRALAFELRQIGSRVSVFLADPGLVDTAMSRLHARNPIAQTWASDLVDRIRRGDTRRPEEIASKLVSQLPHMSSATSGGFFTPETPTGSFAPIAWKKSETVHYDLRGDTNRAAPNTPGCIIQPDKFAKPFDYSMLIPASTITTTPCKKGDPQGKAVTTDQGPVAAQAHASEITGLPRDNFEVQEISKEEFERVRTCRSSRKQNGSVTITHIPFSPLNVCNRRRFFQRILQINRPVFRLPTLLVSP
jgi:NAD(P)-dependent dehydrogenase (short-subunit alcohol dehydrogenase family)